LRWWSAARALRRSRTSRPQQAMRRKPRIACDPSVLLRYAGAFGRAGWMRCLSRTRAPITTPIVAV
jgi:hypothetical protein